MNRNALLVVDVQVAPFVWHQYGGKELYQSEQLIKNIDLLIRKARQSNTPVVYLQYTEEGGSPHSRGMPLWEIHPFIAPQAGDLVVEKPHADPFYKTDLHKTLTDLGIRKLAVTGVQTEFCVDTACRTAFSLGYEVTLVRDGHSTFDQESLTAELIIEHHNRVLGERFVRLTEAGNIEFLGNSE